MFTLTLDQKQLDYIAGVLGTRPYAEVFQLVQAIQQQVLQQSQPQTGGQLHAINE